MHALRSTLATLFCLVPSALSAQQYTAAHINFKNAAPYTQPDLRAASGLVVGKPFTKEGLQAAAQKLIATGLFDDVQVVLDGPVASIDLNFSLKPYPSSQLLGVAFENFVWWQPAELLAELHTRVPLFDPASPTLAESGDEQDAIQAAIESMLASKGVSGARVARSLLEPSLTLPRRTVAFRVEAPTVILRTFTLSGVSPTQAPTLRKFLPTLLDRPYIEGSLPASDLHRVLNLYRNAGFLEVAISDVQRTLNTSAGKIDVDLKGALHEGDVFHVGTLTWAGTPLYSTADFEHQAKLHPGDVASRYMLLETLRPLDTAYRAQGYLDASVETSPSLSSSAHTVDYTITVTAGEQYHLHSVTPLNLTPQQTADFNSAWKLKPGDVYNAPAVAEFLTGHSTLTSLRGFSAASTISADPTNHLVDLTITFIKGGSLVRQ